MKPHRQNRVYFGGIGQFTRPTDHACQSELHLRDRNRDMKSRTRHPRLATNPGFQAPNSAHKIRVLQSLKLTETSGVGSVNGGRGVALLKLSCARDGDEFEEVSLEQVFLFLGKACSLIDLPEVLHGSTQRL